MCLWAARSLNGGVTWSTQRLTDGAMDPDEDVPTGSVQYASDTASTGHFAISFQADPKGLQLGDAEGSGDGASGANVSPGTNIWYTYLSKVAFEAGTAFPAAVQVSDNNGSATGAAGASRANLAISGSTAVIAYEETKGGGSEGQGDSSITASRMPCRSRPPRFPPAQPSATRPTTRAACASSCKGTTPLVTRMPMVMPLTVTPPVCTPC